ncbi:MAG: nucleotidyltransferase domain-containing protein [Candidatus Micrarchaeota archaeon]|nr:nucleotidyltransferase domain-containing protein [Candidatus Micrarchaeota archaeon]
MKEIFETDATWKVLSYFIKNPKKETYPRELERTLKISSGSTSTICKELEKKNVLKLSKLGNSNFYSLNNESFFVRKLKTTWFLNNLYRYTKIFENEEFQAVALYGSYANGEFDEKSDLDILVITNIHKNQVNEIFKDMKDDFKIDFSLTIFTLAQWKELANKNERFYKEVLANHIILYGTSILLG